MKILQLLILVSLGIAFLVGVTSLLSVILINNIARELSEKETPKITTLYQMEILLEESAKGIIDFSKLEQAAEKQEFQVNSNDFNIKTHELRRLAGKVEDKELILLLDDVEKQFSHFKGLGERLISIQENQSKKILERRGVLDERIIPIIDNRLQKDLSTSDPQYTQKQKALLEMEINVHELFSASSGYILNADSSLKERITDSIADFQYWLAQFLDLNGLNRNGNGNNNNNNTGSPPVNSTADTARSLSTRTIVVVEDTTDFDTTTTTIASIPQEQRIRPTTITTAAPLVQQQIQNREQIQYAVVIKKDFDTVSKLTQDIIELEDVEQNLLAEFTTAETGLEDLLDNQLKSIILQKISTLEGRADSLVTMALVAIAIAILLAITLGIVVSNYIVKPIKRLRQAVNEVEAGNLDIRGGISNDDRGADGTSAGRSNKNNSSLDSEELIDLTKSFNSMIEKLKVNNRMEREFLSTASHELRSPIQPILSYADLASKGDMPYDQAIERIFVQARRLQNLANDILDVARIEAGQLRYIMRRVSVNRVIGHAIDSIRDNLRKEVALEIQLLEHDVEIELDEERIIQVLANTLGNAAKFTNKGNIKVETSLAPEKSMIEIRISDTGGGIPEEIVSRLFGKFVTKDVGRRAEQGTGLGLYISKAIVNAHKGTISAFNNREGGATFVISLPIEQKLGT